MRDGWRSKGYKNVRKLVTAVLSCQLCLFSQSMQAQAQTAPMAPRAVNRPGASSPGAALTQRASMDLSSIEHNSFAEHLGESSIGINVNGRNQVVNGATPITPAQRMAAYQVFSTGKQTLAIGEHGNALGGNFTLGRAFANNLDNVVIPRQVDMYHDFRLANSISIVGDLVNNGRILGYSTSPNVTTGIINANNIINNEHALITTVPSTVVETRFGRINIEAGSVVLVVAQSAAVTVFDMHDASKNGVVIAANNACIGLAPGHHVTLTNQSGSSFADINPLQAIGHRNLRSIDHACGTTMFSSEFSLASALDGLKVLSAMQHSTDVRDQKLIREILKDAAIIQVIKGNSNTYHRYSSLAAVI